MVVCAPGDGLGDDCCDVVIVIVVERCGLRIRIRGRDRVRLRDRARVRCRGLRGVGHASPASTAR